MSPRRFQPGVKVIPKRTRTYHQGSHHQQISGSELRQLDSEYSGLSSRKPSPTNEIAEIGSIDMGGSSLSIGKLILSFKELARKNPSTITGSLQRYGSTVSMVAIWNDRKSQKKIIREARLTLARDKSVEDLIPTLVNDLAFQIAIEMFKQKHLLEGSLSSNVARIQALDPSKK